MLIGIPAGRSPDRRAGVQIGADDADHIFEPFWRGDAARDRTGRHCGLGLSLSKRIVECLGGSIHAESRVGGSFSITVSIAANAPAAQRAG